MILSSDPNEAHEPSEPPSEDGPRIPPRRSVYWRPPASSTGAGRFVTVALAGMVGVLGVPIATSISLLIQRDRWTVGTGAELAPFMVGWLAGAGLAVAGMSTITGVAWMVWQHRAHANRSALAANAFKPAVVWWWLVPIANTFMPFRAIRDLARGDHDRPGLRGWWWAFYLLFGVVSGVATILPGYVTDRAWQEGASILSYLLGIVAALLAIRVVRLVDEGLEARRQEQGWPVGWNPLEGGAQFLSVIGAAAAASVGAFIMGMVFPGLLEEAARDATGAKGAESLSVGTCFNDGEAGYPEMRCDAPHEAEAYAVLVHPDQGVYPGGAGIESWAEPLCYGRFERYTGIRYEESNLDFGYLYPDSRGWAAGDHEVICYLFDPSGRDLTGPIGTGSGSA